MPAPLPVRVPIGELAPQLAAEHVFSAKKNSNFNRSRSCIAARQNAPRVFALLDLGGFEQRELDDRRSTKKWMIEFR